MSKYWRDEDFQEVTVADSYADLLIVARRILARMPHPIIQLCGPISSGGAGSVEENLKRFETAIATLRNKGIEPFDQLPFERPMQRLKVKEQVPWSINLLEDFYRPIFEEHLVDELHFLPDWESSKGARWEHEQAKRLEIKIVYL